MPRHCDEDQTCFNCNDLLSKCSCGATETYDVGEGAICPYCGNMNRACDSDGILYNEGTDEYDCGECGREFSVSVQVSYAWQVVRKED